MAKVEPNAITQYLSGKLGNLVFRKRRGKIVAYIASGPRRKVRKDKRPPTTPARQQTLTRFKYAVRYAQRVLQNSQLRAIYGPIAKARDTSIYSLAITDWSKGPAVESIDVSAYQGRVGDVILVAAIDNVALSGVAVVIRTPGKALVEHGNAVLVDGAWQYVATKDFAPGSGLEIEAIASDHPGHTASLKRTC